MGFIDLELVTDQLTTQPWFGMIFMRDSLSEQPSLGPCGTCSWQDELDVTITAVIGSGFGSDSSQHFGNRSLPQLLHLRFPHGAFPKPRTQFGPTKSEVDSQPLSFLQLLGKFLAVLPSGFAHRVCPVLGSASCLKSDCTKLNGCVDRCISFL